MSAAHVNLYGQAVAAHANAQRDLARFSLPLSTRAALASLLARHRVLVVPGWNNSGPAHWQTLWQREFPAMERVEQREWVNPQPDDWVTVLDEAIAASRRPAVLVAHSLGCIAVARWAATRAARGESSWPVAGALLVAPADVERRGVHAVLKPFAPIPGTRLPFTACVVGSSDDPCCSESRARALARQWGTAFSLVENGGHINADSGLGSWPQGLALLAWMTGRDSSG